MEKALPPVSEALAGQLEYLRLPAMRTHYKEFARRAVEAKQTHMEFLTALVEEEVRIRNERSIRSRLAAAKMPAIKTLDGWDWKWNAPGVRRETILPLFDLNFVQEKNNILIVGRQGLGKTRIALALAHKACSQGINTRFTTAADMLNRLMAATADHTLERALLLFTRPKLLIIDEVGYLPFSKEAGDLFFQVIAKRYERGSIILTSNRAFKDWNEIFADSIVAAAIIERLVHHAEILTLKGKSYRLKDRQELENDPKTLETH